MDETTKSIWNKTAAEVTVKDQLIIAAAIPVIMIGGLVVVGAASKTCEFVADKFRTRREARNTETTTES